jgi:preprotein translocase subunit Sec63
MNAKEHLECLKRLVSNQQEDMEAFMGSIERAYRSITDE